MKYLYTLLLVLAGLLISSYSVAQGSLATLDAKNGFRDVKFGAPAEAFPGMEHSLTLDDYEYHNRPSDKLLLGDIPIKEIGYDFNKNRLVRVHIILDAKKVDKDEVLKSLSFAYGGPNYTVGREIIWEGKKVILSLVDSGYNDYYNIYFISKTMLEVMKLESISQEKLKIKKAAKDL